MQRRSSRTSRGDGPSNEASTTEENVRLSKKLTKTLRHKAVEKGLNIGTDGFVLLRELLDHPDFRRHTFEDIMHVVEHNDKKRFEVSMLPEPKIRAAQGHTIAFISDEELLQRIEDPAEISVCVHGTRAENIIPIMESGLNRMGRNHIHMATGLPGAEGVISGMRYSCEVALFIDVSSAMAAGIHFFRSSNGVILTKGLNESGILPPEFISEVRDLRASTATAISNCSSIGTEI